MKNAGSKSQFTSSHRKVRFLTTDSGTLRLHPQLYADGKAMSKSCADF